MLPTRSICKAEATPPIHADCQTFPPATILIIVDISIESPAPATSTGERLIGAKRSVLLTPVPSSK